MNQQTNESPQTIQENLAIKMAEFCGWKETKDPLKKYPVWIEEKYLDDDSIIYHRGKSVTNLKIFFFDPCTACGGTGYTPDEPDLHGGFAGFKCEKCKDHKPNPRGFLMVWDKLRNIGLNWIIFNYKPCNLEIIRCTLNLKSNLSKEIIGEGITESIALYSAVKELMDARKARDKKELEIKLRAEKKELLIKRVAKEVEKEMGCNCDLDKWEPEPKTGHSFVCRIHKETLRRVKQ